MKLTIGSVRYPFIVLASILSLAAQSPKEAPCPAVNPGVDFLTNFNIPCYVTPLATGNGLNNSGDSNAVYDSIFYVVTPGYELVLLGTYPNGRFLSTTVYDQHLAITSSVIDQNIAPLNSGMMNPFGIGAVYQPGQQFGITIGFGSPLTPTPSPGCSASDTTIDTNFLDASQIHSGLSWNSYPGISTYGLPVHISGPNASGLLMVRKYIDISKTGPESVIVRSTATGCAIPASQAISMNILNLSRALSSPLLDQAQIAAHQQFSNTIEPLLCYAPDPNNVKQWFRSVDYVPLANLGASLDLNITPANLTMLMAGQNFIRLRFPAPTTPKIPCASGGCSLTGNENLRYFSISFLGQSTLDGKTTLTSVSDVALVQDPNGNVTLVVGLGAVAPSSLTAANYYNYLDLTQIPNYSTLSRIEIRHLLPNATFNCSNGRVPLFTMEYNALGGFMGQFVPTVDFPTADALSVPPPPPPTRPDSCMNIPGPAQSCGPAK